MKHAIVGAGIGGLITALAFEKNNIAYQLFEKAPKLNEVGAGIWLAPNALQVLEYLGLFEEVKRKGNTIDQITLGKSDLSPLYDTRQNYVKDTLEYATIAIHRAELQKLLLEKIPPEKIHMGKEFNSFERLDTGKVKIKFADNTATEADFLIGADGIHSKVRKQLFPESSIRYSGQTCWRGVAAIELDKEYKNRGIELWGDQIRFGISKIAKNKVYWFAVVLDAPHLKDNKDRIHQKLLRLYADFHPIVGELISSTPVDKILRNDIIDLKPLDNWYNGSICLIGDAGHATTPNMGQGGAQAIEDAYYLSDLIKKQPNTNVFNLFQEKRKEKVSTIVQQSWTTGKMAHWKYGQGLRNFLLKNMPKKVLEKKMMKLYQIDKPM
ncbi:FAD-dependent monooxygenase [Aquimarina pacifica]|uniref:FAD-dependent monooxygenase n=1 Tax=Aquimarina pacifica TaxID=1296415 RepID=UPI000470BB49|nr:FAD-dependent monooxygenase [Aquimarina pacifica]